jgi:hypothetical protein
MGLWDEVQSSSSDAAQRRRQQASQNQLELKEFVDAMKRLGVASKDYPVMYRPTELHSPGHMEIRNAYVNGWPIAFPYNLGPPLLVTEDAQLVDCTDQQSRGGRTLFRAAPPFVMTPLTLPYPGLDELLRKALRVQMDRRKKLGS